MTTEDAKEEIDRLQHVIEMAQMHSMLLLTSSVLHAHNLPTVSDLNDMLKKEIARWR